jgi:hypothetical protein
MVSRTHESRATSGGLRRGLIDSIAEQPAIGAHCCRTLFQQVQKSASVKVSISVHLEQLHFKAAVL